MFSTPTMVGIIGTFFLAGTVKGVIGLGLPTVSLALLALTLDLITAMSLLLIPSFVTNLWQGVVGGNGRSLLRQLWPFFLTATLLVWVGAIALGKLDTQWLTALLGVLLISYATISLSGARIRIDPAHRTWTGKLTGVCNGVLTGMTGSFVVPGVMYLQATGLPRDALVQAMGILFTLSTLALGVALFRNQLLDTTNLAWSAIALAPAMAGMALGQILRKRLSAEQFRRVFFFALLIVGAYIVWRSL